MKNSYPEVPRFVTPQFYSNDIEEAIEQFKTDISKLYTYGMKYHRAIDYSLAKRAGSYLQKKFNPKFPHYSRFINYVYTQDEKYNLLGYVYSFEYFELLRMYIFIKELLSKSTRSRINIGSVLAFFYIIYSKSIVNDRTKLIIERDRIRKLSEHYDNLVAYRKFLHRYKNAVHFYPPRQLYSLIDVADSRSFENVAKLLGINYYFAKSKFADKYVSSIWCSIPTNLKWAYQDFSKLKEFRFSKLHKEVDQIFQSGLELEREMQDKIAYYYKDKFIRNKENAYHLHLNGNPAIRLDEDKGRFSVCVQEKFFDINMLMRSLYFCNKNKHLKLKDFLKDEFDTETIRTLRSRIRKFNNQKISDAIALISKYSKSYPITSPISSDNQHHKQIEKSKPIINEISRNGIFFNITKAMRLKKRKKSRNQHDQFSEEKQYNRYEESDFTTVHIDAKHQSISQIKKQLKKYISRAKVISALNRDEVRIYGTFIPHGAKTHRMTCRNINLQGIKKGIREMVFEAPPGKILLSKDVSGQDIAIAANMAMKLYYHPELFKKDLEKDFERLREQMTETLQLLTSDPVKSKPLNFITNKIVEKNIIGLEDLSKKKIKETVKESVYTVFYGGGNQNFANQGLSNQELLCQLKDFREKCIVFERAYLCHANLTAESAIAPSIRASKIEYIILDILKFFDKLDLEKFKQHLDHYTLLGLSEDFDLIVLEHSSYFDIFFSRYYREKIISEMKDLVQENYPGILESFNYYEQYYNENYLTYPTFLGWQTEVMLELNIQDKITKSKSYPIQASGAEFMREWLIELKRIQPIKNRNRIPIKIVNCIHDQVYVEINASDKTVVEEHIARSAKKAARNLGILEKTISLH